MKRILALALLLLMLVSVVAVFASCGGDENKTSPSGNAQETNANKSGASGNTTPAETHEPLQAGDDGSPEQMGWDDGEEGTL